VTNVNSTEDLKVERFVKKRISLYRLETSLSYMNLPSSLENSI